MTPNLQSLFFVCSPDVLDKVRQTFNDEASGVNVHILSTNTAHRTIEGAAQDLVREILSIQPHGSYCLAGLALGAVVAYEIAIQLIGQDRAVACIAMLDPDFRRVTAYPARGCYDLFPISQPVHLFTSSSNGSPMMQVMPPLSDVMAQTLTATVPQRVPRHEIVAALCRLLLRALANPQRSERSVPSTYDPLVSIRNGSIATEPIFCIPGAGDSVFSMLQLALAIDETSPIYGIQPRGLTLANEPHTTVQAAACFYLSRIARLNTIAPIHLIGHSNGGWVAFEMAQRLLDSGERIGSLTLIDTDPPGLSTARDAEYDAAEVVDEWIQMIQMATTTPLTFDWRELRVAEQQARLETIRRSMVKSGLLPHQSRASDLRGALRSFAAGVRTQYSPSVPYSSEITFVSASDPRLDHKANDVRLKAAVLAWMKYASKVTVWESSGNHITVLKAPYVGEIATKWRNS